MNDQPNGGMAQPDENGGPVQQLLVATKSPLPGASLDRDNEERKLVERAYTLSHPEPAGRSTLSLLLIDGTTVGHQKIRTIVTQRTIWLTETYALVDQ